MKMSQFELLREIAQEVLEIEEDDLSWEECAEACLQKLAALMEDESDEIL